MNWVASFIISFAAKVFFSPFISSVFFGRGCGLLFPYLFWSLCKTLGAYIICSLVSTETIFFLFLYIVVTTNTWLGCVLG